MSLVEILPENFANLRNKFSVNWPKHITAFSLLNTFTKRYDKSRGGAISITVYSLDGNWEGDDATFIAKVKIAKYSRRTKVQEINFQFERNIAFGTLDPEFRRLKVALKLLDYSDMLMFTCIPRFYSEMLDEIIDKLKLNLVFDIPGTMVHLCKEDAKKINFE